MNTPISRRDAVRRGLIGASGLLLAEHLEVCSAEAEQRVAAPPKARAKAVIHVWLGGGPAHVDTFDPKPEAGSDYCGPYDEAIETNVPGIRVNGTLPLLAKQAHQYAIVRSATHGNTGHEDAAILVHTGRRRGGKLAYPSVGLVVSALRGVDAGYAGKVPPLIVLTQNPGPFSCYFRGFMDSRYAPFLTGGDPSEAPWAVEGIVAPGMTDDRQRQRRGFLQELGTLRRAMADDPQWKGLAQAREEAYDMMLGEGRQVYDLSKETDEVRDRYGRHRFGQSCLAARRLVEAGALYITINDLGAGTKKKHWDTHQGYFANQLQEFDQGLSALLDDLSGRGLLESTIVWCGGEFGRTPKWEGKPPGGRNHWPQCFSVVLAGGGFKGGQVVGASDATGSSVKDRPVYPCDVIGSIYHLLGIAADAKIPHPRGIEVGVLPDKAEAEPSGGLLKEIM